MAANIHPKGSTLAERIAACSDKSGGPHACWPWTASVRGRGHCQYGQINYQGRMYGAHRIAYELKYGLIPPGMVACHCCDNPRCVNPDHIFIASQTVNLADMTAKGRRSRGYQTKPKAWREATA